MPRSALFAFAAGVALSLWAASGFPGVRPAGPRP